MSAFQPFRDLIAEAEPLEGFVVLLRRCPTAADSKGLIMAAHGHGALTDAETGALITGLMLETD